jgi:hypothetical protein
VGFGGLQLGRRASARLFKWILRIKFIHGTREKENEKRIRGEIKRWGRKISNHDSENLVFIKIVFKVCNYYDFILIQNKK